MRDNPLVLLLVLASLLLVGAVIMAPQARAQPTPTPTPTSTGSTTSTPTPTPTPTSGPPQGVSISPDESKPNGTAIIKIGPKVTVYSLESTSDGMRVVVWAEMPATITLVERVESCTGACALDRKTVTLGSGKTVITFPHDSATAATSGGIVLLSPKGVGGDRLLPRGVNPWPPLLVGLLLPVGSVRLKLWYDERYSDTGVDHVE